MPSPTSRTPSVSAYVLAHALVATGHAALVTLIAVVVSGCQAAHAAPSAPSTAPGAATNVEAAVPVELASIEHRPIDRPLRTTGQVRPGAELDLAFEAPGKVVSVLVEEGALVKKGQVLARLDGTLAHAATRQAEEASAKADRDLVRARTLEGSGALPSTLRLDAETGAEVARASLAAAHRAQGHALLVAPDDGRIEARNLELGGVVGAGQPVLRLAVRGLGPVVRVAVSDRDVLGLALGGGATITLDVAGATALPATVTKIASAATPGSGTFAVEVRAAALPAGTPTGLSAKVEIARLERPASLVPVGALVDGDGDRAAVYVAIDGRAKRVPVGVAFLSGDRAALREPLDGFASVVERGAPLLVDARAVRVVLREPLAPSASNASNASSASSTGARP